MLLSHAQLTVQTPGLSRESRLTYHRSMPEPRRPLRPSREVRLLIVTMLIAGSVLLLLATLRFPERPAALDTSTQPLERLAARASFEELATQVARLESTVAAHLIVLSLTSDDGPRPLSLADISGERGAGDDGRHVPALRMDATTAVACMPPNARIAGVVGGTNRIETASIIGRDAVRHLARLRVPEGTPPAVRPLALSALRTPTYVVAVEGTRAGVTVRPVFLGRSDRFTSARWTRPLLPLGGAAVTSGALVFTLDGEFLGCAVVDGGTAAIASATDVLEAGRVHVGRLQEPGITVQLLTAPVAAATGASRGVVVAEVLEGGAAAGALEPGDVIVDLDGRPVVDPTSLLLDLAARLGEGPVRVNFVRGRQQRQAALRAPARTATVDKGDVRFEHVPRVGTRVDAVPGGSPLAAAGVAAGDTIVAIGDRVAPTPAQVTAALGDTAAGGAVLVVVRRGARQHVTAVRADAVSDAAAR